MRKTVMAMLLVVVMLFSVHYADAEDIDLTQMSTKELQTLRERINVELNSRPKEVEPKDEQARRNEIYQKYQAWSEAYDFDSILADIEYGNHGLSDACAQEVKTNAGFAKTILEDCKIETDPFTGEFRIIHTALKSFGDGCQVYPYIDGSGFNLIVGFPYKDSFHYDQIFFKCGSEICENDRFDRNKGFDIQFETLNGKHWEYSTLNDPYLGSESIEAVSFREDGSVRKENYELNEQEVLAVNALYALADLQHDIYYRILHWELMGD